MKKFVMCLLMSVFAFSFTGCTEEPKETIVLKLAETYSKDHITTQADYEFAKLVEEKSNGAIRVEVHTDGELGTETDALNKVFKGEIDLARVNVSSVDNSEVAGKIELPYLYKDKGHMWRSVEMLLGPALDGEIIRNDGKIIAYLDAGERNLYTKNPVETAEDLKGLRIRTIETSALSSDYFSMLGANITPMESNDVLTALESNNIDGAENDIISYYNSGHYKQAKNVLKMKYRQVPDLLVMTRSLYDKLSDSEQDIIMAAANEAALNQREKWEKTEAEIENKLKAEGCNFIEPSKEFLDELQQMAEFVYRQVPRGEEEVTLLEQVRGMR